MAMTPVLRDFTEAAPGAVHRAPGRGLGAALKRDKGAIIALVLLGLVVLACIAAPLVSPHDELAIDPIHRLAPPGTAGHWLGSDGQGRDILSRLIWGGRISLLTGVAPVVIGLLVGGVIGTIAGYFGGITKTILMRVMDVLIAFPAVLLAIGVAMTLGPGTSHVIVALTVVLIPSFARIAESASDAACATEYMDAARASGTSRATILRVQLLKNVASPPLAYAFSIIGQVIVFAAGLNYLGLGVQPPTAEWGSMLFNLQPTILEAPWTSVMPGIPIALAALLFDRIGSFVRDLLDPRSA